METIITYRGRCIDEEDIATIRKIISDHPEKSRRFISQEVCRVWNWRQQNGFLKDMVCRSLLLLLESKGLIVQPPRKCTPPNPLARRKTPRKVDILSEPISVPLKELFPIRFKQVRKTPLEKVFNSLIDQHHYLGYTQAVGEHLKYLVFSEDRVIACLTWGSAPWFIGARDRFIGWSPKIRERNLHLIVNNLRFLILPWVRVPHLGSYLLAIARRQISSDWESLYHHPVYLAETFVDTTRFSGTCYRADNWICVGETTGRGKPGKYENGGRDARLPIKAVYLHPLTRVFKELLTQSDSIRI